MRFTLTALLPAMLILAGCSGSYDDPLSKPRRQTKPGAFGVVVDPLDPAPAAKQAIEDENESETTQKPTKATPDEVVREEATVGVGEKGRGYGGGMITTPISVYFRTQERIIFNVQIPHELKLYKAMHGEVPQTFEEFEEKIIKPARIDLPTLPGGYRYVWDPEEEKLMVEHPKK